METLLWKLHSLLVCSDRENKLSIMDSIRLIFTKEYQRSSFLTKDNPYSHM